MADFTYNKVKNASISYMFFKLNYNYYFYIFYKNDLNPDFKSRAIDKLAGKLRELITFYQKNLRHAQEL